MVEPVESQGARVVGGAQRGVGLEGPASVVVRVAEGVAVLALAGEEQRQQGPGLGEVGVEVERLGEELAALFVLVLGREAVEGEAGGGAPRAASESPSRPR